MKYYFLLMILVFIGCVEKSPQTSNTALIEAPSSIRTKESAQARYDYEMNMVCSPSTGKLPANIHSLELQFTKALAKSQTNLRVNTNEEGWVLTGPFNVGGRTRAMALDLSNERHILAGGVSGGMWKSTDEGNSWRRTSSPSVINSITCIAQDPSEGEQNVWYYGTGELLGNSAREVGAPYRGDGIFKSTDGGDSWDVLSSTQTNREGILDSPFNYAWNMVVKPSESGAGELYVALFGGIVRSLDGGVTWETVLGLDLLNSDAEDLNQTDAHFFTNIILTPSGRFYATLSILTASGELPPDSGVYTSVNGTDWVNITPQVFPLINDRTVMTFAPSNENILYLYTTRNDANFLHRLDAANMEWSDLSDNLPDGDGIEALDSQSSYNMALKVHPENENTVFLGGTNLYRSTDGFSSRQSITHIGGYDPDGSFNLYPNHHPDQHEIVFFSSDANKMLTANDGGIRLTENNLADSVIWESINRGYTTSQFYTVAMSQEEGSPVILGGMQDNGTYLKPIDDEGNQVNWARLLGGDGSFCASTPEDRYWYISFQDANIFRVILDDDQNITEFAQVDPEGGFGYLFINPYVLDPNNFNRMYLAGGPVIWRNDNLLAVPSGDQSSTEVGWTMIDGTVDNQQISTLDISTEPSDIVYYGNNRGEVFRLENADDFDAQLFKVNTLDSGYVSSISIDPLDADHFVYTYSNYNIQSVFVSFDGGVTTTAVGGNLEENEDGSGIGPSVRFCKIIPLENEEYVYYVGTSTGLFKTRNLDGHQTEWVQVGENSIGNSVVRHIDYRSSDGKIVVATHGNGVYEGQIANTAEVVKGSNRPIGGLELKSIFPNPFTDRIDIDFSIPEQGKVEIDLYNNQGEFVSRILNATQFAGDFIATWDGTQADGRTVVPGLYIFQARYRGQVKTGKILFRGR